MQTPAEKYLIKSLAEVINVRGRGYDNPLRILNIGAGKSFSIETQLNENGCKYVCDRVDVEGCEISHPNVGNCYQSSVESMSGIATEGYAAAFANFLLEHVENLEEASREIYRCLEKNGVFIATVPNPSAPELRLSRWTPLWFHRVVRGGEAWETHYSYGSIGKLTRIFESAGFCTGDVRYFSFVEGYLYRFFPLGLIGLAYDGINNAIGIKGFMGNVCIIFEKP